MVIRVKATTRIPPVPIENTLPTNILINLPVNMRRLVMRANLKWEKWLFTASFDIKSTVIEHRSQYPADYSESAAN